MKLRSEKDIELHVEKVRRRRNQIKVGEKEYILSDLVCQKNERIGELKNAAYNDLEDMVFRMELTYREIAGILDTKYNAAKTLVYILSPGKYNISYFI